MREQRRLNLEASIREYETQRAIVERRIAANATAAPPEWTHELTMLQAQIANAERELAGITSGDQQTQSYRRAVDQLNQWYGDLQKRILNVERAVDKVEETVERLDQRMQHWIDSDADERHVRQEQVDKVLAEMRQSSDDRRRNQHRIYWIVVGIAAVQVLMAIGLYWFGSQVWLITELWR